MRAQGREMEISEEKKTEFYESGDAVNGCAKRRAEAFFGAAVTKKRE